VMPRRSGDVTASALAATVSTLSWLPEGLRPVRPDEGLPKLAAFGILMLKAKLPRQPATDALEAPIRQGFRGGTVRTLAAA